jgi:hypothetical protein
MTGGLRAAALAAVVSVVACLAPATAAHADASFAVTALAPAGPSGSSVRDVAVGDLDGRNGPDIVTSYSVGGLSVNLNNGNGNGTFSAPHLYPTGCDTAEVELADLGGPNDDNVPDGHLDAAVVCNYQGNTQYLGRLAGDGNGGFGAADIVPALTFGPFAEPLPQQMALADVRGPGLPPVPVFTALFQDPLHGTFTHVLCFTNDWVSGSCLDQSTPETLPPLVAGVVADARVFGLGGSKGLIDWGPFPNWHSSTRELAPNAPATATQNSKSITIGDLAGDGPDMISASGTCPCGQTVPAAGVVDISYGDLANGVPDQAGTQFASAPGVTNIATGDFDLDGHTDLIGTSWSQDPATQVVTGAVFVQPGNGAGALAAPQIIPISHDPAFSRAPIRVADFDRNGAPDAAAVVGGQVQVLLNQKAPGVTPPASGAPPVVAPKPGALHPLSGIKGLPKNVRPDRTGNLLLGSATNPPTATVELTITLPPAKATHRGTQARAASTRKKRRKKTVVLARVRIKVAAHSKRALKLHLSASALARLKTGSLKATLTLVAVAADGTKAAVSRALTIEPARGNRRHRR